MNQSMNKQKFIAELKNRLTALPQNEIDKSIAYYEECIQDRIEDGMTEEDAIAAFGDMDTIVKNIMYDMSIPTLMKAKVKESKKRASSQGIWISLVIIGFPLWFPLLIAFATVILSVYVAIWAIIVSLYAVVLAFGVSGLAGIFVGIISSITQSIPTGLCTFGVAFVLIALTLFLIKPVYLITKGLIRLTVYFLRKIKSLFITEKGTK